jgi:hypothetical protein
MKSKLTLAAMVLAIVAGSAGLAAAQDYHYNDREGNRYYGRDDSFRRGLDVARDFGYRDGAQGAREDMWKNKRFNPNPRGNNHADNGYRGDFGSKREYREQYSAAYRDGYTNAFRRDGYNR